MSISGPSQGVAELVGSRAGDGVGAAVGTALLDVPDRPAPPAVGTTLVPAPAAPPPVPPVPDVDLGDVAFAVVDVETTGGSPDASALTEVAVGVFAGGRCLDLFDRLVQPETPIPPFITALTGISAVTVAGAPPAGAVLPELCQLLEGRVLVGHNLPFDVGFLDRALQAAGLPVLDQPQVDTLPLARRLVGPRVPNCRLATLADALALAHWPSHRALADVLATADLLHHLLVRLRALGVHRLPQLVAFAVGSPVCSMPSS